MRNSENMTKEKFVECITELEELRKVESEINNGFKKIDREFNYISFGRYDSLIVQLLEEAMNDTSEWISWWIYEADFGNNHKIADSVTVKGEKFRVRTAHRLYDLITME